MGDHNADTVKLPPPLPGPAAVASPGDGVPAPVDPLGGEAGRNLDVRFRGETEETRKPVTVTENTGGNTIVVPLGPSEPVGDGRWTSRPVAIVDCTAAQRELDAAVADLRADKEGRQAKRERVRLARERVEACEAAQRERLREAEEAVADEPRPVKRRGKVAVAAKFSWNVTTIGSTLLAAYYALMILTGSWRLPWVSVEVPVPRSARVLDALYRRGHVPPEAEPAARKALIEDGVGDPEGGGR